MSAILETVKTSSVRLSCGRLTVNGLPAQFTVGDLAKAEADREIIRRDYGGETWWEERPRDYGAVAKLNKRIKGTGRNHSNRWNRKNLPKDFVMALHAKGHSGAQIARALFDKGIVVSRDLVNKRIKGWKNER